MKYADGRKVIRIYFIIVFVQIVHKNAFLNVRAHFSAQGVLIQEEHPREALFFLLGVLKSFPMSGMCLLACSQSSS
jgi:hypothetical protein